MYQDIVKISYVWENLNNVVLKVTFDVNFIATFVKFVIIFYKWILINYIIIYFFIKLKKNMNVWSVRYKCDLLLYQKRR